ncbi:hypothetical protein K458DRAFT_418403 [Lentithecium fluviatile CBS 122367]|uniref:PWI domain-containing protein n=1 Tax=Lentithecium fluviatile CBS 122367 TaxID=1168545 RepID=A0A6G1J120_9PLEO|nr:hypothetical protein K458DRAFT_418403 [Lentithecium fluviatile CBS 122367]
MEEATQSASGATAIVDERDRGPLKTWLEPKLAAICNSESSILAEYVIALINNNEVLAKAKKACVSELQEFLHEHTEAFVNETVHAIETRSWTKDLPKQGKKAHIPVPKRPAVALAPSSAPVPSVAATSTELHRPSLALDSNVRTFHPRTSAPAKPLATVSSSSAPNSTNAPPSRFTAPFLSRGQANEDNTQVGRGGKSRKRRRDDQDISRTSNGQSASQDGAPRVERPRKKMAGRERVVGQGESGANRRTLATAVPGSMPALPPLPPMAHPRNFPISPGGDFPFDPTLLTMMASSLTPAIPQFPTLSMGRGQHLGGQPARCNVFDTIGICYLGPLCPLDHSLMPALPQDDANNNSIDINSTGVQNAKQGKSGRRLIGASGAPPGDLTRRQAEAQKAFEDRRTKAADVEAKKKEIRQKLKMTVSEKRAVERKLNEKLRERGMESINKNAPTFSHLDLASMQAQAQNLHARPDPTPNTGAGGYHATPYRSLIGRGRGPSQGRGRGRGAGVRRGGVLRVDFRSKRVAIAAAEFGSRRDVVVRQRLSHFAGCNNIYPHPDDPETLIASFDERWQAEAFHRDAINNLRIAGTDLTWVPNDVLSPAKSAEGKTSAPQREADDKATKTEEIEIKVEDSEARIKVEEVSEHGDVEPDLDVAEEDQWV